MSAIRIQSKLSIFTFLFILILTQRLIAEVIYVDSTNGSDTNPGTQEKPTNTISKAATIINNSKKPGPTKIVISPGLYCLEEPIFIDNERPYNEKNRLTITASILPDESEWRPVLMPTIISVEVPKSSLNTSALTETYSIKVKINHVTIQGLKFLGNPSLNNMHGCVERIGKGLNDLLIKQCVFIGDRNGANIYAATLATGDRFVVEHCIFKGCAASAVYWDGLDEIGGRNCAMRYCIIDEAYMSGPWTCQTTEDFEFHHNVVTNSEYFWGRKQGDRQKYKINKCVIIGNKHFSGYGTAAGPTGQTGDEVTFEENNIIKEGIVHFETNQKSRNYMHIKKGSIGKDLGAGLFAESVGGIKTEEHSYRKEIHAYKEVDGHEILADVYLPAKEKVRAVVLYMHGGGFMFGSRTGRPRKPLLDKLIEANYTVVSIDYRMAPETKLEEIIKDARDACIWIRSRGPSLFNADPDRLGVIGGSAGAFLATACGYTVKPKPQAIVAISGFADFEFAKPSTDRSILEQNDLYDSVGKEIITQGGEDRYKLCFFLLDNGLWPWEILGFDPTSNQEKVDALLPINHINSDYPATLLIHSKNDQNVPFSQADKLSQVLTAQKTESELFIVPKGHSSEIIRNDPKAVSKIVTFLNKYLKKP